MDENQEKQGGQICHIDILFPVTSDEQALEIKRLISKALTDVEHKRFRFSISEG